jgi:hypothetical protein
LRGHYATNTHSLHHDLVFDSALWLLLLFLIALAHIATALDFGYHQKLRHLSAGR